MQQSISGAFLNRAAVAIAASGRFRWLIIIKADCLEDATEVAQGCPLLEHCEIYVRPLVDVPM